VGETVHILIIDDNDMQLQYLTDLFSRHGYSTRTLNDSTRALETMVNIEPKLVILDLMMPKLDGFTILKSMRDTEKLRSVPVIIYTGKGFSIDEKKAKNLGANSYIVKPVKGSVLVEEVKKYI
jgi:DNA-binding response OmpR family regulator